MKYSKMIILLCMACFLSFCIFSCGNGGSSDSGGYVQDNGVFATSSPAANGITSVTDPEGGTEFTAGQKIIIKGSGFGDNIGQSYVTFDPSNTGALPVDALSYAGWTNTQIECTIPISGIVSGNYQVLVTVVASSGATTISSTFQIVITSLSGPQIVSIDPGNVNRGASITIHGDGFGAEVDDEYESVQNGGYVIFGNDPGGVIQTTTSYWSRTLIICQVPSTAPLGSISLYVVTGTNNKAKSSLDVVDTVTPTIGSIKPAKIDKGATTPITIMGTNFGNAEGTGQINFQPQNGAQVSSALVTSWSEKKIICPLPSGVTNSTGNVLVSVTTGRGTTTNKYAFNVDTIGPLLHGPRLGLITQNNAAISWDTNDSEIGEVKWGTSSFYTGSGKENTATTRHRFTIEGLSPSTTYHYAVVAGGKTQSDHTFTTAPPDSAQSFSFISMADNRGDSDLTDLQSITQGFKNIMQQVQILKPAFVLHAGDLFYGSIQFEEVEKLYDTFKKGTDPVCGDFSMLISPGNHEMKAPLIDYEGNNVDPNVLFNQEFGQPNQLKGYEGTTYSFNWGNTHIVSIDTCHYDKSMPHDGIAYISDTQLNWLESDLKNAQAKKVQHIFVFGHVNAFSEWKLYYLGSVDPSQRNKFWNILAKYNVDAYICGHMHLFNTDLGEDNVIQWLNGNSGCKPVGKNQFTLWNIYGDSVTASPLNEDGSPALSPQTKLKSSQPK